MTYEDISPSPDFAKAHNRLT